MPIIILLLISRVEADLAVNKNDCCRPCKSILNTRAIDACVYIQTTMYFVFMYVYLHTNNWIPLTAVEHTYNSVVSIIIHQWLKLMTCFCCSQSLQHAPIFKVLKSSNMHIRCSNYLISFTFCLTYNCITTAHTSDCCASNSQMETDSIQNKTSAYY